MGRSSIHRVVSFTQTGPYTLDVTFEDGTIQRVDFEPILHGQIFGPLRDPVLFAQVAIDPEVQTLVWPNGADMDPAVLYGWPELGAEMATLAQSWDVRAS